MNGRMNELLMNERLSERLTERTLERIGE